MSEKSIAVLIDADNISPACAGLIFKKACTLGKPIARRAYGMVNCFSTNAGWPLAQREYGIVSRPQVGNVAGKNVADIALVIDAMEFLYKSQCDGICIVSSDSDYTALAAKIRESGKSVYGMGDAKTPESFRTACSEFFEIHTVKSAAGKGENDTHLACPRCGGKLSSAHTRSNRSCRVCASCGGMLSKLSSLNTVFPENSLTEILERARKQEQPGCICPDCGSLMSIVKVSSGTRWAEIDVCGKCRAVWYDKNEFSVLAPDDGLLLPTVSSGKSYRREMVAVITADLKSRRLKVLNEKALKNVLRVSYKVPPPDIAPIISTLMCQRVISNDKKTGRICVLAKKGAKDDGNGK